MPVVVMIGFLFMALGYAIVDQYRNFRIPGEQRTAVWSPEGSEIYQPGQVTVNSELVVYCLTIKEMDERYKESGGRVLIEVYRYSGKLKYALTRGDGVTYRIDLSFPVRAVGKSFSRENVLSMLITDWKGRYEKETKSYVNKAIGKHIHLLLVGCLLFAVGLLTAILSLMKIFLSQ